MNTRPYSDLYGLVEALCGCTFAAQEAVRVKYFINRRAQRAYAESEYWPRFYVVGEERIVSEDGLLPYEQTGLSDIGTVLRIHASEPMRSRVAAEYGDFYAASGGIQITGYSSGGATSMVVTGILAQDATGTYYVTPEQTEGKDQYALNADPYFVPNGVIAYNSSTLAWSLIYKDDSETPVISIWEAVGDVETPDLATGWTAAFNATGTPTVESTTTYSAFITYKAALSATYGDTDGDTPDVPEEWFEYMAHGAYSDFLRNDQQQDRAALAEQEANEILMAQLEKIGRQNGSSAFTRVVTQANTQWR